MRAASYGRKSTTAEQREDGLSVSVVTQRELARAWAEKLGGQLVAEFADDARSGADFTRPGLAALLAAAERHEFDTLIVADRSRIGRDQIETPRVIHRLTELGVTVVSYDDSVGAIARPNSKPIDLFMGQVSDYASAELRAGARRRAREGLAHAFERGNHTGGLAPYGYRIERPTIKNERGDDVQGPARLVVDERWAWVRVAIDQMEADGHGLTKSAKILNGDPKYAELNEHYLSGERPPCPGYLNNPKKYLNPHAWCGTALKAMRENPVYYGKLRFGAMQNYERGGRVHLRRKQSDADKVMLIDAPHLRIIPPELEAAAKRRRLAVRETYATTERGQFWVGRPESGLHSPYLLSVLMRCRSCGGSMAVHSFRRKGRVLRYYACSRHRKRGSSACGNALRPPMHEADALVLAAVQTQILTEGRIEEVVRVAAKKAAEQRRERPDEEARLAAEIAELRAQVARFIDAIGAGRAPDSVMSRITDLERQVAIKEKLLAELGVTDVVDLGERRVREQLRKNLQRFRELVGGDNVPLARAAIRKLLGDEVIWFAPKPDGRYDLTATTRLGPLLQGCCEPGGAGGAVCMLRSGT